ncbi:MAG: hypothetical protein WC485_12035, partial [Opitutaceae bacterium]
IIWAIGGWWQYLYTGDREFLELAFTATRNTITHFEATELFPPSDPKPEIKIPISKDERHEQNFDGQLRGGFDHHRLLRRHVPAGRRDAAASSGSE